MTSQCTTYCEACYTDLAHCTSKLFDPYLYKWIIEWARHIPDTANHAVLERFALALIPKSYIDIVHTRSYVKAINLIVNNPVFDPTFNANVLLKTALAWYYNTTKGAISETQYPVYRDNVIVCFWSLPVVRTTYVAVTADEFEVEVDDETTFWSGKKYKRNIKNELTRAWRALAVKQCKSIKGELMEKTWHPSRVWDWCFDEDEKREIGLN